MSWALEIVDRLPRAEFVTIPGTGHCSHISRPEAFNRIVESWLERSFPEASAHPEPESEEVTGQVTEEESEGEIA